MAAPSINGQLGWNQKTQQIQYIIAWDLSEEQDERPTSLYGTVDLAVDETTGRLSIATEYVPAGASKTIRLPNLKFELDVPEYDTDLYVAIASGYSIRPPEGKVMLAGGIAYHITALPLPGDTAPSEIHEFETEATLKFRYERRHANKSLDICYFDRTKTGPDGGAWRPVSKVDKCIYNTERVAWVKTKLLGTYALMMRDEDYVHQALETAKSIAESYDRLRKVVAEHAELIQRQQLTGHNNHNAFLENTRDEVTKG